MAVDRAEPSATSGSGSDPGAAAGELWGLIRDVGMRIDAQGRVGSVTPSVTTVYGFEPHELRGRPLVDLFEPAHRVTVEAYLARPELVDPEATMTMPVACADGSWRSSVVRFDRWHRPDGGVGLSVALRPVDGSIDVALAQERTASEKLQLVDEMKHRLLEAVSHELRTPLTIIGGFAETLQRGDATFTADRLQQIGASIDRQAVRLQRIVSDLMDLDRVSRGALVAGRREVDLADAVIEVAEQVPLGGRSLNLELDRVSLEVDRAKFDRIVEALLVNARRHTPPDTTVWVRLRAEDRGARLEVADDGPGLSDDLKATVFSPFAQGSLLDPHAPGLGLGLALVHRFARLHGGRAWVEDRDGGGSRFCVELPPAVPEPDSEALEAGLRHAAGHERALHGRPEGVELRPEALAVVDSMLRTARRELGMRVAYLSVFTDTEQVVVAVDGDGVPVGISPGQQIPLEDTYCVRMVRGEIGNLVVDTSREPVVANLPSTDAGLACYAGVPVRLPGGQVFGTLCCAHDEPRADLQPTEITVLNTIAEVLGDQLSQRQLLSDNEREIARRIEQLLSRPDTLRTVYQPIVDLTDGHVAGVEALTRFPDHHIRPPDVWFADAERVGFTGQLEQLTVMRALTGLEQLDEERYLSINLSPATVLSGGLRPLLGRVPLHRLVIEITEHAAVADYEALQAGLRPFRAAGTRLAIDDVGSGFASLRHVLRLRPDIIKIDRSLIEQVTSDPGQHMVVSSLAELASQVGADIVAEGVEDTATLTVLRAADVTHVQGWVFDAAGPLPLQRDSYPLPG